MEIGNRVQKLDGASGFFEVLELLFKQFRHDTVGIHVDVNNICLILTENTKGSHIRGSLGYNNVAGVNENTCNKVDGLLRTSSYNNVIGVGVDALEAHNIKDLFPKFYNSLTRTVLKRYFTAVYNQVAVKFSNNI